MHKDHALRGVSEQLLVRQLTFGSRAVLLPCHSGLEGTEATQLAFHRHADRVRDFNDLGGNVDVVFIRGGCLHVLFQGPIHHHTGEAGPDGSLADGQTSTVVLVHDHRDVRPGFNSSFGDVAQKSFSCIFAGPRGSLQDYRAVGFVGGLHDRLHLLLIVYVESRNTVVMLGGVVEQLTQRDHGHRFTPLLTWGTSWVAPLTCVQLVILSAAITWGLWLRSSATRISLSEPANRDWWAGPPPGSLRAARFPRSFRAPADDRPRSTARASARARSPCHTTRTESWPRKTPPRGARSLRARGNVAASTPAPPGGCRSRTVRSACSTHSAASGIQRCVASDAGTSR